MSVMCHTTKLCHVSRNVTVILTLSPAFTPTLYTAAWEINDKESKTNPFRTFFWILETSFFHPSTCPFHHLAVSMASLSAFL